MNQDSQPTAPSELVNPKDQATPQPPIAQPVQPPSQPAPTPPSTQPSPVINIQAPQPTPPQPTQPTSPPTQEKPTKPPLDLDQKKEKIAQKLTVLIGIVFGAIEVSLAFRLIFKLLGANPNNAFIGALYQFTNPFVAPFVGIFNVNLAFAKFSLDVPTIIAAIIYSLIGYGLLWAVRLL